MTNPQSPRSFKVGIEFESVLAAISQQIYETPLAFLRENVQNAVDALRIQAFRDKCSPGDEKYSIHVHVNGDICTIRDNGIGMTEEDLKAYFWTIGASGKRGTEAIAAGCVGMFGIGGFANLGVCKRLSVISQAADEESGTETVLSEDDIRAAGGSIPSVNVAPSKAAEPRGTLVCGELREAPDVDELQEYLHDFVKMAEERVFFNDSLISNQLSNKWTKGLSPLVLPSYKPTVADVGVNATLYEDKGSNIIADIHGISVKDVAVRATGQLRFEAGGIDAFKRGFKLCATKIVNRLGVNGWIDCDRLSPTAGRDSLDATSYSLLNSTVKALEAHAVWAILQSTERIAQHTRAFAYIIDHNWSHLIGKTSVSLADSSETTLVDIERLFKLGRPVFYGSHQKKALSDIMLARGHIVVIMPGDTKKSQAIQKYLELKCDAKRFDGIVECIQEYQDLDRFELFFLSELELCISSTYDCSKVALIAGKLSEDLPVYIKDPSAKSLAIYVDTQHQEVTKLQSVGMNPLAYSLIAAFCREYLGTALRQRSPKFFGSGAIDLEALAKKRSELWVLVKDDLEVHHKGARAPVERAIMRATDVEIVVPNKQVITEQNSERKPKLLLIEGDDPEFSTIFGYYIRLPEGAVKAYGDVISECDSRGGAWAGNRILFIASDRISTAFQFEVRLDSLIHSDSSTGLDAEGSAEINQPIHELHNGLYFPIPPVLKSILVPSGDEEIRIEVRSELIDMANARKWVTAPKQ